MARKAHDGEFIAGLTEAQELDEVFARLYDKIRNLAARVRWGDANPTLNPTALVHEAYLKLRKDPPDFASRSYDEAIRIFSHAMRQILIDGARRKRAQKRISADLPQRSDLPAEDAIAFDAALEELERENVMQARIVECRFLLGVTVNETALPRLFCSLPLGWHANAMKPFPRRHVLNMFSSSCLTC